MNEKKSFLWEILIGFFVMRVMAAMWFRPIYSEFLDYHFSLAASSSQGYYPFLHYWMEYPPIFPWISVGIYQFLTNFCSLESLSFYYFFYINIFMALCEVGILYLIFQLSKEFYDESTAQRSCFFYILLFFPLCAMSSYFDSFPTLFLLAGAYLITKNREKSATICIALGTMVKIIPIVLLPVLWKKSKERIFVVVLFTFIIILCLLPFVAYDSSWLETFGEVTLKRQGWETPWALLDNQYSFGYLGPEPQGQVTKNALLQLRYQSRFQNDTSFVTKSSGIFPYIYAFFGILFLLSFIYFYRSIPANSNAYATFCFSCFCLVLFFIYSKGWSPQFIIYLLPFILIALPEKFYLLLLFSIINFIELRVWLFSFPNSVLLLTILIIIRTLILIDLLLILAKCIRKEKPCLIPVKESES